MKPIADFLNKNERMALARLYETNDFKILVKYIEALRLNQAKNALDAQSYEHLRFMSGQAAGLKLLVTNLKELHKQSLKN